MPRAFCTSTSQAALLASGYLFFGYLCLAPARCVPSFMGGLARPSPGPLCFFFLPSRISSFSLWFNNSFIYLVRDARTTHTPPDVQESNYFFFQFIQQDGQDGRCELLRTIPIPRCRSTTGMCVASGTILIRGQRVDYGCGWGIKRLPP